MKSDRDQMRASLQETVVPLLRARSFSGSFPHFRRLRTQGVDLLSFHFNKFGGSFIVEIATAPRGDLEVEGAEPIPEGKLEAWHLDLRLRARIRAETGPDEIWFSFKPTLLRRGRKRFDRVAMRVAELLPQADAWWSGVKVQPNVKNFSDHFRHAV